MRLTKSGISGVIVTVGAAANDHPKIIFFCFSNLLSVAISSQEEFLHRNVKQLQLCERGRSSQRWPDFYENPFAKVFTIVPK
ncbi:MAG: hypothetical protein ABIR84_02705 [Candidatus Nitrotoga sp.]